MRGVRHAVMTVLGLSSFLAVSAAAQSGPADSVRAPDIAWARAYVTHDTVFAGALFGEDFVMTRTAGLVTGREAELSDVRVIDGLEMHSFRTEGVVCRVYDSAVVVTGLAVWSFTYRQPQPTTLRRRYTAVYVRGGRLGWRLVAVQMGNAPD